MAQKKQERYIYVPLVRAVDWLDYYVIPKLFSEHHTSILGSLKTILSQNKHCPASIDTFGATQCATLLEGTRALAQYQKKLSEAEDVTRMMESGIYDKSILSAKAIKSKTDELVANKVEGAFFIDNIIDFQNGNTHLGPHVAVLSEPSSIPRHIALEIADGLDHENLINSGLNYGCIDAKGGEMSYILGNVRSPYIELALQKFSALYSRIGVDDPSTEMKNQIAKEAAR
ncbi:MULTISPECIES: hypothetical protein [unclassified Pseudomonas]|uniref:hypothetical protein n=1 Tax=unclassified Pseudomonas TaxID=196821 RepID=UPI0011B81DE0|nr:MULTISPECIES: hypothetical protein [unclassified Pseudomonas]